jgi:hypothetical protein
MTRAVAVALLLVCLGPVAAQGQLTLNCTNVPLPEVVKHLRQLSGVPIIGGDTADAATPPITLDLTDVTVEQALAEACKQAGWHYERFEQGYRLVPGPPAPRPFACRVGDYEVVLERVSVLRDLTLELVGDQPRTTLDHRLGLSLSARSDDEDKMAAIAGFDSQVTAVTDTGVELRPTQRARGSTGVRSMEQVVRGSASLPAPPEEARALARVEGDLILFAQVERSEYEFAIDQAGQSQDQGGATVTFVGFDRATGIARVRAKITQPRDAIPQRGGPSQPRCAATLMDANGRPAAASGQSGSWRGENGVYTHDQEYYFRPDPNFQPAKLKCQLTVVSDPSERLTYVFENIPLPSEENVTPPIEQLP